MIRAEKNLNATKSLLATVIILVVALAVCFYVFELNSENKRLTQTNKSLLGAIEKEREKSEWLIEEMRALEQQLRSEYALNIRMMPLTLTSRNLYPELRVTRPARYDPIKPKVIYLTFDNGPLETTDNCLDLLKKYNVKATFFVVGRSDDESRARVKRMADEGHTVAPHTYTHEYEKIYASVTDYLHDFKHINDLITSVTGQKPDILRFPGGSVNPYNEKTHRQIIDEVQRRGYTYYDWSVSYADMDANGNETAGNSLLSKIKKTRHKIVVLPEDSEDALKALENLIVILKKQGYTFERLTNKVEPVYLKFPTGGKHCAKQ